MNLSCNLLSYLSTPLSNYVLAIRKHIFWNRTARFPGPTFFPRLQFLTCRWPTVHIPVVYWDLKLLIFDVSIFWNLSNNCWTIWTIYHEMSSPSKASSGGCEQRQVRACGQRFSAGAHGLGATSGRPGLPFCGWVPWRRDPNVKMN